MPITKNKNKKNHVTWSLRVLWIQDKDRLKKEMLQKVNEIVSNFRKISDKQMAETTKRTIMENIAIQKQVCRFSCTPFGLLCACVLILFLCITTMIFTGYHQLVIA